MTDDELTELVEELEGALATVTAESERFSANLVESFLLLLKSSRDLGETDMESAIRGAADRLAHHVEGGKEAIGELMCIVRVLVSGSGEEAVATTNPEVRKGRIETFMASARHQVEMSGDALRRLKENLPESEDLELARLMDSFTDGLEGLRTLLADLEQYARRVYGVGE